MTRSKALSAPEAANDPTVSASTLAVGSERALTRHLTQLELARRWSISPRTLERWRWLKHGPCYLKIMGRVVYRLEDIEAFESANRQEIHAASGPIEAKA